MVLYLMIRRVAASPETVTNTVSRIRLVGGSFGTPGLDGERSLAIGK